MNEASRTKTKTVEPEELSKLEAPVTRRNRARKWLRRILLAPLLPLFVLGGAWLYENTGRIVSTENAYVKANITAINSNIAGQITNLYVRENQHVKKGDLLFKVTSKRYEYAVEAADAELAAARIEVDEMKSDYRQLGVELKEAAERIRLNKLKYERQQTLESKNVGRKTILEEARYNLAAARQHQNSIREQRRKILIKLNGDLKLPVEEHPLVKKAVAAKKHAITALANTRSYAPADGIISNVNVRLGSFVKTGGAVFSLIETNNLWIEANLKETQLTYLHEGQDAEFIADAYPDIIWPSRVQTISPATGSEFALLPAQNASGNWVKVVQRLPVRFSIEPRDGLPTLRAGMTVTVSVDTKRERRVADLWQEVLASAREVQEKLEAFNFAK